MKVISIALQKGGTAKTTTAVNLAANLAARKKRVLLIDMDFQANATFASGVDSHSLTNSLYNVLTPDHQYHCEIQNALIHTDYYDIVPADKDVVDLPLELKSATALKDQFNNIRSTYDYVIIDCPPALNIITLNALVASDHVIIPAEPKPFNFTGLVDFAETIQAVQTNYNHKLAILGILLVKYNRRTNLAKTMQDTIADYAKQLQTALYTATIREATAVPESQLAQKPLLKYAPSANPTIDYKAFTTETLKRLGDL